MFQVAIAFSSACDFLGYLLPVILGHTRWPISKMALVGLSLVTVEVKSSDPPGTGQMIKSPNHGQTCYVKSPAFSLNVRNNLGGIVVAVVDHQ